MRTSRKYILGALLLILGTSILMDNLGVDIDFGSVIGPLVLFFIGATFYGKKLKFVGQFFFVLGIIVLIHELLNVNIGGFLIAAFFVFVGYRLIRGKADQKRADTEDFSWKATEGSWRDTEREKEGERWNDRTFSNRRPVDEGGDSSRVGDDRAHRQERSTTREPNETKSSLIGDLHMGRERYELKDMNIWHGIGDVKIDLSQALIPEGETVLIINGWIGDIDIYVPYDLEVSVNATAILGDLDVLNHRQGGFNRHLSVATEDYKQSTRRVKIMLSLFIGDIDVRLL